MKPFNGRFCISNIISSHGTSSMALSQITNRFGFSRYIAFDMHLDIYSRLDT
jgi:hypothetical protein